MASSSQTNPTYSIPSFNAHDRLIALHQEITDFLHYQLHIQYAATTSLLLNTSTANQREQQTIIEFLKEECAHIKMLKWLLDMVDDTRYGCRSNRHEILEKNGKGNTCHHYVFD